MKNLTNKIFKKEILSGFFVVLVLLLGFLLIPSVARASSVKVDDNLNLFLETLVKPIVNIKSLDFLGSDKEDDLIFSKIEIKKKERVRPKFSELEFYTNVANTFEVVGTAFKLSLKEAGSTLVGYIDKSIGTATALVAEKEMSAPKAAKVDLEPVVIEIEVADARDVGKETLGMDQDEPIVTDEALVSSTESEVEVLVYKESPRLDIIRINIVEGPEDNLSWKRSSFGGCFEKFRLPAAEEGESCDVKGGESFSNTWDTRSCPLAWESKNLTCK